jgi:hypothetical protein
VLSNEDKHRAILARAIGVADEPLPQASIRRLQDVEIADQFWVHVSRPLEDGAEVCGADIRVTGPNPEMEVHFNLHLDIAFGQEMITLRAVTEIRRLVSEIIEQAAELL